MRTERKQLSKKIRFEVFKRDSFVCQYCGASAPDVVLQVDHIKPVSRGGKNNILNLITSCFECNSGKRNEELGEQAEINKQKRQLENLNERRLQLEMLLEWKEEMLDLNQSSAMRIAGIWQKLTGYSLNDDGLNELSKLLRKFGASLVIDSLAASVDHYMEKNGPDYAFEYIERICISKKREAEDPMYAKVNHVYNRIKNNMSGSGVSRWVIAKEIRNALNNGLSAEEIVYMALDAHTWQNFVDDISN